MKILLIILIFIIIACEIQYDGETKIILTGKIIDKTGNPISNKNIEINIDGNGTYSSNDLMFWEI
jgi:protocatechuate 3,4-dioxygenase beta subunit